MHDVLIVGVPLLMILAGLFFNNRAISDLKTEIRDVRAEIRDLHTETRARFDRVDDRLTDIIASSANMKDVYKRWNGSGRRIA